MSITAISHDERPRLATERWQLDPSPSTATFRVRTHWGLHAVRGHFGRLAGQFEVDEFGRRSMLLTIDADSLVTGNARRDRHLRSSDFFDCEHYPHVRFQSINVGDGADGSLLVTGELEVAGESAALELEATARRSGDALEIDAHTTVDHRRFGMSSGPLAMIRPQAVLSVHARLRRVA